jgi:outer membrane immunogenic protein
MKQALIALAAAAAFTGSTYAADLPARMPVKAAPPPVPVASWTGCYIGGGGGYGVWNQENQNFFDPALIGLAGPRFVTSETATTGGRGYFGTVQGGCDYQFGLGGWNLVVGAFADGDWGRQRGTLNVPVSALFGDETLSQSWAVGGRVGVVVFPGLLTYFSGGYTEAHFDRVNLHFSLAVPPLTFNYFDSHTYHGWFLGAGDEYALKFLPGLFWKTEYRLSEFNRADNIVRIGPAFPGLVGQPTGGVLASKKWDQTIRSELVYRFNWGGPVVAKY